MLPILASRTLIIHLARAIPTSVITLITFQRFVILVVTSLALINTDIPVRIQIGVSPTLGAEGSVLTVGTCRYRAFDAAGFFLVIAYVATVTASRIPATTSLTPYITFLATRHLNTCYLIFLLPKPITFRTRETSDIRLPSALKTPFMTGHTSRYRRIKPELRVTPLATRLLPSCAS